MGDVQLVMSTSMTKSRPAIGKVPFGNEAPAFTLPPRNARVSLGGNARLEGKVCGSPEPQVFWFRNGKAVIAGGRYSMEQSSRGTFSLLVKGVQKEDAGPYTCEAVNDAGSRQITVEVILEENAVQKFGLPSASKLGTHLVPAVENRPSIWGQSPPKFVTKPSRLFLKVGQTGKFSAKITGRPQPLVQWFKGEELLHGSEHYSMFERSGLHFLEIRLVCAEDAGMYKCLVTNSAGKASATAELIVQGLNKETDLPKANNLPETVASPAVDHTSNGFLTNQTPTGISTQTAKTKTNTAVPTSPVDVSCSTTMPVLQKNSVASALQSFSEPKNERTSAQGSSVGSMTFGNLQTRKSGYNSNTKAADQVKIKNENESSRMNVQSATMGSGKEMPRILHQPEVMETQPSFDLQLDHEDAPEETKVTFTCQGRRLKGKPPFFNTSLKGCTVSEGQNISLQCSVEARPQATITWLFNDKAITYGHAVFDGAWAQLTVQDAVCADEGLYSCVAENEHGQAVCTTRVLVNAKADVKKSQSVPVAEQKRTSTPVFLKELHDLRVMDGSQVTMTVEVAGHPSPEVLWLHNGKEIQESEDFHFESKGNQYSLFIQEVFPEDTGTYTCEAWNKAGEARTEALLTVQEPQDGVQPWFITKPKSSTVSVGHHALLSCAIAGDPFPEFLWMKDGQAVSSGQHFEVLQKEDVVSLFIRRVKVHHAGNYEVHLKNKIGECSAVVALTVKEEADQEPQKVEANTRAGGLESTEDSRQEQQEGPSCTSVSSYSDSVWDCLDTEEQIASRGLLKRRVETKEHREDQIRQKEAEQIDFRTVLGRKVTTKSVSEEDLKEITAEQMDFRGNLQRQIKPKTQSEEERKINFPQQVDFRAVLNKKGAGLPRSASSYLSKAEPSKTESNDFRSVLNKSKKQENVELSRESFTAKGSMGKVNNLNCVDATIKETKNGEGKKDLTFTQKLNDVTVVEGELLQLQCQLSSESPATVTWTLDGKVIKPSKFILISYKDGLCSLIIEKSLPEDEGQYLCKAESPLGKTECCCVVLVKDPSAPSSTPAYKKSKNPFTPITENEARIKKPPPKIPIKQGLQPQILEFPDDMKILAGERVALLCKFTGAPPINCTWLKFRKPIQAEHGNMIVENTECSTQLTIAHGEQEHCGCYTVEIRNNYGMKQAALNLTIVDKPDPPARIPAATDIRKSSLTLSWYGPTYDGGSAVLSYMLEVWNSVDKEWKELVSCNSTSFRVQNLLPEIQYKFRVRAVNVYGIGEPSAESAPVQVGLEEENEDENKEEDMEPSDGESEKQPVYRNVVIRTDVKFKELYDVGDRLGSGKFGTVFKLVEKSTKKSWAGKFIKAYSAKEKENVRQEIEIMNDLHHPKLAQCIDAFESKSDMVMVLEMVSGGELFERIIDEDFELTEREVIKYMLQIVDGVSFIHRKGIVHLDLKPENIMCVNKTGSKIKLIDFGLARRLETAGSLKVMFGTPEFVAPEVINYEAISYPTDMWSIGVICYILLSGLSPFMGDSDHETLSNVTSATWDFEDEAFDEISDEAKDFISNLLKKDMKARLTCQQCFEHSWLKQDTKNMEAKKLSKERMKKYILRRRWQKTGHAVRAIGRLSSMAMLAGVHAKKGSPTEEKNENQLLEESEQRSQMKPFFSSVIGDVEVIESSAARFDCKIEGFPDPEVIWYKDGQPIKETRHYQIDYDEDGNCSLVIPEVCRQDGTQYTCKAVNSLGEATCSADLNIVVMGEVDEEDEAE